MDISLYAIEQAHASIREISFGRFPTEPLPHQYDLIVSIEVLEHMPKEHSEKAIRNLCMASEDILSFSSTPFDYKEITHWNVQVPEYWAEQFAKYNFYRDVDFDASFIMPGGPFSQARGNLCGTWFENMKRNLWPLKKENFDCVLWLLRLRMHCVKQLRQFLHLQLRWNKDKTTTVSRNCPSSYDMSYQLRCKN